MRTPPKEVMDALPDEPMDGSVCEIVQGGRVYVWYAIEGKWNFTDTCLGDWRSHGEDLTSFVKEREVYV